MRPCRSRRISNHACTRQSIFGPEELHFLLSKCLETMWRAVLRSMAGPRGSLPLPALESSSVVLLPESGSRSPDAAATPSPVISTRTSARARTSHHPRTCWHLFLRFMR